MDAHVCVYVTVKLLTERYDKYDTNEFFSSIHYTTIYLDIKLTNKQHTKYATKLVQESLHSGTVAIFLHCSLWIRLKLGNGLDISWILKLLTKFTTRLYALQEILR